MPPGSSPLARGLPATGAIPGETVGIIPARAGFTTTTKGQPHEPADHPRSRGVYAGMRDGLGWSTGSSPLARGLRCSRSRAGGARRIIPARAGFTHRRRSGRPGTWDHPRSRGVYDSGPRAGAGQHGSSPLARGLLQAVPQRIGARRIIPARAGFTCDLRCCRGRRRDHPRSRGVYTNGRLSAQTPTGSSPLARGLRICWRHSIPLGGIIPARAGFTRCPSQGHRGFQDHPRSRGVYFARLRRIMTGSGSSPLARGLRRSRR